MQKAMAPSYSPSPKSKAAQDGLGAETPAKKKKTTRKLPEATPPEKHLREKKESKALPSKSDKLSKKTEGTVSSSAGSVKKAAAQKPESGEPENANNTTLSQLQPSLTK